MAFNQPITALLLYNNMNMYKVIKIYVLKK